MISGWRGFECSRCPPQASLAFLPDINSIGPFEGAIAPRTLPSHDKALEAVLRNLGDTRDTSMVFGRDDEEKQAVPKRKSGTARAR